MVNKQLISQLDKEQAELKSSLVSLFMSFVNQKELNEYGEIQFSEFGDCVVATIDLRDSPNSFCGLKINKIYSIDKDGHIHGYSLQIDLDWNDWNDKLVYKDSFGLDMSNEAVINNVKLLMKSANMFIESFRKRR